MTEVDRLQAAIVRLETLQDGSLGGPWTAWRDASGHIDGFGLESGVSPHWDVARRMFKGDAELVEALHRTIDAQLAVLAYGATLTGPIPPAILGLASAILGEQDT